MTQTRYFALIPAAGAGTRVRAATPKQYLPLCGKPMLWHTIQAWLDCTVIDTIFVVVSADDTQAEQVCAGLFPRVRILHCGGQSRQESVANGLLAIESIVAGGDWVLVHDAARPGLQAQLIERLIDTVKNDPVGGLLALPVADTIKRRDGETITTVCRDNLWLAQTPQMFRYRHLKQALAHALQNSLQVTDEASVMEEMGMHPKLVFGDPANFKVTQATDIALAQIYLREQGRGE